MKKIIFLFVFSTAHFFSFGQEYNFENNFGMEVIIGSEPMDSLWQIGVPEKTLFNSAYSEPNAIMTDRVNSYPANMTSSFVLEIDEGWFWSFPFMQIEWQQKFDVELGVDGGIVEASYDGGVTWQNVLSDPDYRPFVVGNFQINPLFNGEIGFTGQSSDWSYVGLCWGTPIGTQPDNVQTIHLRFTFVSDSNDTNQEGWMIDNFGFLGNIIGANTNQNNSGEVEVYPNPTDGNITVKLPEASSNDFRLKIVNNAGQIVYEENIRNRRFQNHRVSIEDFSKGIYFLSLKTGNQVYQQKLIKL